MRHRDYSRGHSPALYDDARGIMDVTSNGEPDGSQYAFQLGSERLVPVRAISQTYAKLTGVPRGPHKAGVERWLTRGYCGVVLPSVKLAGRRYTSEAAIRWWIAACSAAEASAARSEVG